ncbi:MAG TPA: TlpA disulfide reductase family protein [Acidimicrobiales bacterium]|nr:TlpA disulfide reductase family protein [Acidimicrobiales bacterium]
MTKAVSHQTNPRDVVLPPASTVLGKGARAPLNFTLSSLVGDGRVSLSKAFHARPGVVNFFASWCTACQTELSALRATASSYGSSVAFVGIDTNDAATGTAADIARRAGVGYPLGVDTQAGTIATAFGVSGLPTTFVVDSTGHVRWETLGAVTEAQLKAQLGPLLARSTH